MELDTMQVIIIVLGLITLGIFGLVIGMLSAGIAERKGASSVYLTGIIGALLGAGLCGYLIWFCADVDPLLERANVDPRMVGAIAGFITGACALIFPVHLALTEKNRVTALLDNAPGVMECGLRLFEALDSDRNGLVVVGELEAALDDSKHRGDHDTLSYMLQVISEVGHVIDSYTTTTMMLVYNAALKTTTLQPTTQTHYVYGISRKDLHGYEEHLRQYYQAWL